MEDTLFILYNYCNLNNIDTSYFIIAGSYAAKLGNYFLINNPKDIDILFIKEHSPTLKNKNCKSIDIITKNFVPVDFMNRIQFKDGFYFLSAEDLLWTEFLSWACRGERANYKLYYIDELLKYLNMTAKEYFDKFFKIKWNELPEEIKQRYYLWLKTEDVPLFLYEKYINIRKELK